MTTPPHRIDELLQSFDQLIQATTELNLNIGKSEEARDKQFAALEAQVASGRNMRRPAWTTLRETLRPGDVVVVPRPDRRQAAGAGLREAPGRPGLPGPHVRSREGVDVQLLFVSRRMDSTSIAGRRKHPAHRLAPLP